MSIKNLSNREYTKLVNNNKYPVNPFVPLDDPFINENGKIQNLLLEKFTSATIIESVEGSIRANHYHKTDWHYAYVITGKIIYLWRAVNDKNPLNKSEYKTGDLFFTPPMFEHVMFFPEKTKFITFAKNTRDHESHENDLVRIKLAESKWNSKKSTFELIIIGENIA